MTKAQFKKRWNSNKDGGGITFDDIAQCAIDWKLVQNPRIQPIDKVVNMVLKAAGCKEDFKHLRRILEYRDEDGKEIKYIGDIDEN